MLGEPRGLMREAVSSRVRPRRPVDPNLNRRSRGGLIPPPSSMNTNEINRLKGSIANEAPEAHPGIHETNVRNQISHLENKNIPTNTHGQGHNNPTHHNSSPKSNDIFGKELEKQAEVKKRPEVRRRERSPRWA